MLLERYQGRSTTNSFSDANRVKSIWRALYILDEPSIGLHQRDNDRLIESLKSIRDLGNTLIVVEHDEDTMRAADYLIDIGPGAGEFGGEIIAAGTPKEVEKNKKSLTGQYLAGKKYIPVPANAAGKIRVGSI